MPPGLKEGRQKEPDEISDEEKRILEAAHKAGQEKKKAAKKERPKSTLPEKVKTPKGEVKTNEAMSGFFNAQPKAKWKGK